MLFNSLTFAVFLPVVFALYWLVPYKHLWMQNLLLLAASYVFYGWWDWRLLILLCSLSCLNYLVGRGMHCSIERPARKILLGLGLFGNIGMLFYFKYCAFFIKELVARSAQWGVPLHDPLLKIILPVGISFYTFLSISYIVDVYHRRIAPPKNIIDVLLTLSFFPIVLAGPLERPRTLLPQLQRKRVFDRSQATDGLRQILWGLFAKVVIADNCAEIVNIVFQNYRGYSGSTLVVGTVLFTIQIYADFSGYSNIAIGVAKQFGIEIARNFNYPYFATSIVEFWRRWNMSLTQWFRDYVFLPIAYRMAGRIDAEKWLFINTNVLTYIVGISITWLLTGLWHGANYTFILWGGIHGSFLILQHLLLRPWKRLLKALGVHPENHALKAGGWLVTFAIVCLAWVFFRADSIGQALGHLSHLFSSSLFQWPQEYSRKLLVLIPLGGLIEWLGRKDQYAIANFGLHWPKPARWAWYYGLVFLIFLLSGKGQQYIYFRF